MAEILPFRAVHYNPEKVPELGQVLTQPYDKISAEMAARYRALSTYNLVRVIRGAEKPGETPRENVYSRAAASFHDWIRNRVLVCGPEPALYLYHQEYALPEHPETKKLRRGFIALCRLEDYSAGIVHRHEETLVGVKADRLELLKATRAHFGQLFVLYSDPEGRIEGALAARAPGKPWQDVQDEFSTRHSVWRVTDPGAIERTAKAMREKKLVIADGHHRYETALAYRDYCRAQGGEDARAEYVMMTFVRLESDGLMILPTHRVAQSLSHFDWGDLLAKARRFFEWEEFSAANSPPPWEPRFLERLATIGGKRPAFGAYAGSGRLGILSLRDEISLANALPEIPPSLARLDVVVLHRLLLEAILGVDHQAVQGEKTLRYVREFPAALEQVESKKAQVCLLMNPTRIQDVWENALAGRVLPQKSTDFYPKLLSGLAIYWLDNPAGI